MGFKDVNTKSAFKKATDLAVGESIVGHVLGFEQSPKYADKTNLIMQNAEGERIVLGTAGNISYMIKDNKIKAGLNTRITRNEDRQAAKGGKTSSNFTVEQDSEDAIEVASQPANTASSSPSSMASTLSALKGLQ